MRQSRVEIPIEFLFATFEMMATGFNCIETFDARRYFIQRPGFTQWRSIIISCIEKDDRCVVQLLQVLSCVEHFFMWCFVRDVDDRISRPPRQLTIKRQTNRYHPAYLIAKLRLRRDEYAVVCAQGPACQDQRRFNVNA